MIRTRRAAGLRKAAVLGSGAARPMPDGADGEGVSLPTSLAIMAKSHWRNAMALTMMDKKPLDAKHTGWPSEIAAEFEREAKSHNGCVGQRLLSENDRVRVWEIRLKPGERFGFHRHVLDYFWSVTTNGKARAHIN